MLRKSLFALSTLGLCSVLFSSCVVALGNKDWDDDWEDGNSVSFGLHSESRSGHRSPLRVAEENRIGLEQLEPGMTEEEVHGVLTRQTWVTGSRNQITNPHRREFFALADGTQVVVLYYYTDTKTSDGLIREEELSPVWFENGRLVGWGKAGFETWSAQAARR